MYNQKILLNLLILLLIGSIVTISSCKKDEDEEPVTFALNSLTADGIDLDGATSALNVPEDAVIEAVFSSAVDASTVTASSVIIEKISKSTTALDLNLTVEGSTVSIVPVDGFDGGSQYSIELTDDIKGTNGAAYAGVDLSFRTSGIFVPQKENMVLFLSFDDGSLLDEAGSHSVTAVETLGYVDDRRGTANSAAYFTGLGNLVEVAAASTLISPSITISFWMKTDLVDYNGQAGSGQPQMRRPFGLAAERGYFLEMGRRSNDPAADGFKEIFMKLGTNHVNVGNNAPEVPQATAWSELNSQLNVNFEPGVQSGWSYGHPQLVNTNDPPNRDFIRENVMDKWIHFVLTFDAGMQEKTFYIDGVKMGTFKWISSGTDWLFTDLSLKDINNDGSNNPDVEGTLAIGSACSRAHKATGWAEYNNQLTLPDEERKFFKGAIDQWRIFSVPLTDDEVNTLYENEK
jgi:hypothetical protein